MKIVLMHGKDTDPNQRWYPWLKKQVEKKGVDFIVPKLPNADTPKLEEWLEEINKTKPDKDTILIGHSRGGLAILRWLEKLPEDKKVMKVILVAANNPSVKKIKEDKSRFYGEGKLNFEKIKAHCDNFVVLHSKDDPWVPFKSGEKNAKGLNAKFKIYEDKRHFGFGFPEVPEILEEIFIKK